MESEPNDFIGQAIFAEFLPLLRHYNNTVNYLLFGKRRLHMKTLLLWARQGTKEILK